MRKLLLATVAALGASMGVATVADAQTASPAPGTVTVRLNGRFRFYGGIVSDRDANNNSAGNSGSTPNPTGNVNAGGVGALPGTNKQSAYGFGNYGRLFPGFDGVAANGLKYGASLEIRQDNSFGAGGGAYGGVGAQNQHRSLLFFQREWGYIGTDQLGTIRLGSSDQPSSLYMTGNFEDFNDGGLNGDIGGLAAGNTQLTWPFADSGSYYSTTKAIYLSPQLYGFDFGVSYEPNTGGTLLGDPCNTSNPLGTNFVNSQGAFVSAAGANGQGVAGPGCDRLSSSPINDESARRKNTVDVLLRYRGTFGAFGIAATAGYIGGGHVLDNSGLAFTNNPQAPGGIQPNYDGLNIGDFGVAVTFGGFSVGGKYQFGRYNGQVGTLVPKGLPDSEAALVGFSYTFGPAIVGAHYLYNKSAGDAANAFYGRQRTESGIAAGATYSLAPGLSLFASYLYGERKQNGYNFVTGQGVVAGSTTGNAYSNKIASQIFAVGTGFSW